MKRFVRMLFVVGLAMVISSPAWGFPGILQLGTRSGFWTNEFPDKGMFAQHFYYYETDEWWNEDGDEVDIDTTKITASFSRAIRAWHFGDRDQYQYILEFIVPAYNISSDLLIDEFETDKLSGLGHPLAYTSIGWNNPSKTTHLQGLLIWQVPLGDEELMKSLGFGNNHALMPGIGFQQRWGNLWLDASIGYWYNFENLESDAKARDYFEVNVIPTYHFSASLPWWVYVQGDYIWLDESEDAQGKDNDDDGYNVAVAPGVGIAIRPNMTLDVKYTMDVDGENTLKGNAINFRFFWVF